MAAATGQPSSQNAVIIERLDSIRGDIGELKAVLTEVNAWRNDFQAHYATAHAELDHKSNRAHLRVDEIERRAGELDRRTEENMKAIRSLENAIQPMIYTNRILAWLGGLLGVSMIALIWSIVIGQVSVVFP